VLHRTDAVWAIRYLMHHTFSRCWAWGFPETGTPDGGVFLDPLSAVALAQTDLCDGDFFYGLSMWFITRMAMSAKRATIWHGERTRDDTRK